MWVIRYKSRLYLKKRREIEGKEVSTGGQGYRGGEEGYSILYLLKTKREHNRKRKSERAYFLNQLEHHTVL